MSDYEKILELGNNLGQARANLEQLRERVKEKDVLIKILLEKLEAPAPRGPTKEDAEKTQT